MHFEKVRKVLELHQTFSKEKIINDSDDRYRVDRYNASEYFDIHEKRIHKIHEYFDEIKKKKEKIIYVDICGRASGEWIGADKSYCFSFKTPASRELIGEINCKMQGKKKHDAVFIDGDIFNSKDFADFIEKIKSDDNKPALVTFNPMAGLQDYRPWSQIEETTPMYKEVTFHQLEKRLQDIVEILKPGGYVYIEKPFQGEGMGEFLRGIPQNEREISQQVKKMARKLKCTVEIRSEITGPYYLLRKPDRGEDSSRNRSQNQKKTSLSEK